MASSIRRLLRPDNLSFVKLRHARLGLLQPKYLSSTAACRHLNTLYSAVCLERLPVITASKTKVEKEFSDMMSKIELENSHLSDNEVRRQREEQLAKKKREAEEEGATVEGEAETALDIQDRWDAEMKTFTPASRLTQADTNEDVRSIERKLDSTLYLLVKQTIEGTDHWVMPQATWKDGETLRQTAERALSSTCGKVQATFLGNAPCAVAKFDPKTEDKDSKHKVFFFKAWYRKGQVTPSTDITKDYLWVTREELAKYCNTSYATHLKKFVYEQ